MGDISVSSDSMRLVWHISEDLQNSISDASRWRIISRPHAWRPPTDVYETDNAIIIRVEIAGMRETDFAVSLIGRNLRIRGVRQETSEKRAYYQMEIPFGEFSTEFELPYLVNSNKVEAIYRDGFLLITLPILQPKRIEIDSQ